MLYVLYNGNTLLMNSGFNTIGFMYDGSKLGWWAFALSFEDFCHERI
jgi:hypothetical protein